MGLQKALCVPLACLCLVACSDPGDNHQPVGVFSGDFGVVFDAATSQIRLIRTDEILLLLPADGLQLGRVDRVSDDTNYDPWLLLAPDPGFNYPPPAGLVWLGTTSIRVAEQGDQVLVLALAYGPDITANLRIEVAGEGRFRFDWTPATGAEGIAYFQLRPVVDPDEGFYGLGGTLDRVNHRGRIRAMQLEADLSLEGATNEAHVPVPFVIGTRGWGLFVECPYPGAFDVANREDDRVAAVFGTGPASGAGLVFHLYAADHPLDITRRYYDTTGDPLLPAPWAYGPWVWRDENDNQAQVLSDLQTIRDLDLATSGIWIDRPYASGVNSFDFNPDQFDAPQAMIDTAHDLGFRLALWHTPYLDKDDPAVADLRQVAQGQGYFPPRHGVLFNHWGEPIDFTNPQAFAWWQEQIRHYTGMGVEGFKLDYAEDVVPGILGARTRWEFADGSDERSMHSGYQLLYHRVYAETLPESGGFLLCRGGTYGDQRHVSVIWPGDLDADMSRFGDQATQGDEPYTAVGGLPASLIYGLSLGPSGFPFYGSDTGGYRHSPPDKETFTRWFEQTALSSVMQIGTSTNNVAWEFTPGTGFDEEMLGWYRGFVRLHLRLWPYVWSLARNLVRDGRPLQRPLGLAYPEMGQHPDDLYLLGPDLLVAPVVERGARQKNVIFPPGKWVDWFTGQVFEGPNSEMVDAPLASLPLYLRQGGIVAMLRPTIDTLAPTDQPEQVDSYATNPGVLYPRVYSGPASSTTLFDGTSLTQEDDGQRISLHIAPGDDFRQGVLLELLAFGDHAPASVTDNAGDLALAADATALQAAASGWTHSAQRNGSLFIKVEPGEHQLIIDR